MVAPLKPAPSVVDHNDIQVEQEENSHCADVDEAERHTVLRGKITLMSGGLRVSSSYPRKLLPFKKNRSECR